MTAIHNRYPLLVLSLEDSSELVMVFRSSHPPICTSSTLAGTFSLLFTLTARAPPLSLKLITGGNFCPLAVAAKATVNPFSALIVFIQTAFSPFLEFVLKGSMSSGILIEMWWLCNRSEAYQHNQLEHTARNCVPDRIPTPNRLFHCAIHPVLAVKVPSICNPPANL